jgi:hypothetical protein
MEAGFLPRMRDHMRARNNSKRTEEGYLYWARQFLRYHDCSNPANLDETAIAAFLEHLALNKKVSPSTQKTALYALVYLYRKVLGRNKLQVPSFSRASESRQRTLDKRSDKLRRHHVNEPALQRAVHSPLSDL